MADYQRVVDDVRSSLYVSGPAASEIIRAAAIAYGVVTVEVNERLRRCNELLKSGLRSEAIQQCELELNLLDVVATLDFPERDYWVQLLNQHGIAVPGPLLLDVAAELNEAYAIEQPLETLLDRHRLLALAHSPLKPRINTLRKLAEVDTNNPIWREDLILFERQRHKDIQREASDAASANDVVAVATLEKELKSDRWLESPPAELVRLVSDARARFSDREMRRQLEQIERELNDAYAQFDEHSGRRLREQWLTLAQTIGLQEHAREWQRAAPALEWLAQQDAYDQTQIQFAADVESLEEALNSERPAIVLKRLYRAVVRHEQELPAGLETRVHNRLEALQVAALKRRRLILVATTIAVVALIVVICGVVIRNAHQQEIDRNSLALRKLLDEGKLPEAEQYLTTLKTNNSSIAASSEFNELSSRLVGLEKKENDRQHSFTIAVQAADHAAAKITDWDLLGQAQRLLSEARQLSRLDPEKDEVKRIQSRLISADRDLQNQEIERVLAKCDSLRQRLAELNKSSVIFVGEANQMRSELKALQQSSVAFNATVHDRVEELLTQLNAVVVEHETQAKAKRAIDQITQAVGSPTVFRQALDDFAVAFPTLSQSADFRQTAQELPLWECMAKYSALASAWRKLNPQQVDAKTARAMVESARTLLNDLPDFPDAAGFRERIPFLEAIARRLNDKGEHAEVQLRSQFVKPWMTGLWLVEMQNGLRYYTKLQPDFGAGTSKTIKYIVDFDLSEKSASVRREDVKEIDTAPQSELATKILEMIRGIENGRGESTWDRGVFDVAQTIHQSDKVDPLLRFLLLQQTIEVASQGSQCIDIAFGPLRKQLNDANVNIFANWLDPNDKEARTARTRAEAALRAIPDLRAPGEQAAGLWKSLAQPVGHDYRWIGWLQRDRNGNWQCTLTNDTTQSGDLSIVRRNGANREVILEPIGALHAGKAEFTRSLSRESQLEGRPVYLVAPAAGK